MGYDSIKIGQRVYFARQNNGLKQLALCDKAGISQSTLSEIENGKAKISVEILYKIAEALNVSVTFLLGEDSISYLTDSERLEVEKFIKYIKGIRNNQ
jgi:transcriptional regulator with XRE-family HTH domain